MTRKRFVKLMMSIGYSRNEANEIAKITGDYKLSWLYGNWQLVKAFYSAGICTKSAVQAFTIFSKALEIL